MQLLLQHVRILADLSFSKTATALRNTLISDINISQGSVVTRFRCGGIFNDSFIANFQEIVKLYGPVFDAVMPKILLVRFFPDTV